MNNVGDAFAYPFRSPGWVGTVVLQGLILIIPIIGWIALLGWLLLTLDNLRAGRQELAPAGFHLRRGIALFGVELIYAIAIGIVPGILQAIGNAVASQNSTAGAPLLALAGLLQFAGWLLLTFLTPVLISRTGELGFAGGMDVPAVWRRATANVGQTVLAAVLVWVAGVIGALGLIVCIVGVLFTAVYANGVTAGIVSWYERAQTPVPGPTTAV
jgi:Protein of unknown function (DUF4013)